MEAFNSVLNIFHPQNIESGVYKYETQHFSAIPPINGALIFEIPATGDAYINLKKSQLRLKFRIVNSDGSILTPGTEDAREERAIHGDIVTVSNLPMACFFRQVDVCLNDQNINADVASNYAYKGYIDMLLNTEKQDAETILQSELCYNDTVGFPQGDYLSNYGFTARYGFTKDSATVVIKGPIRADICQQDRLILPGVRVSVKMYPAEDSFRLHSMIGKNKTYKLEIMEAVLEAYKITPNPCIIKAHQEVLKQKPSILPFTKSYLKNYNIREGSQSFIMDDLFYDKIPNELIICMINSEAYNGKYQLNPFVFEHFKLSYLEYMVNGVSVPGPALTPDFEQGDYVDCYNALFTDKSRVLISRDGFEDGYTIFRFSMKEDLGKGIGEKVQNAHSRLKLKFKEPLEENVTLIVYGKFSANVEINMERKVTVDN